MQSLHQLGKQRTITREDLANAQRILIKVGTTVVTQVDGTFALSRLGNVVEEIAELMQNGKEVILVSSGAVGKGSQKLYQQALLSLPLQRHVYSGGGSAVFDNKLLPARACASAGQSGMMSLYDDMFEQKNVAISQILVTETDFLNQEVRQALQETLETLLKWRVLPIINENDVISLRKTPLRDENNAIFWDNDSLAALIAKEIKAELVVILTDVDGIYTLHPNDPNAEMVSTYRPGDSIVIGQKSRVGRGGMQAKIDACLKSINTGVPAVIIASGYKPNIIRQLMQGQRVGTLFVQRPPDDNTDRDPRLMANDAKQASLILQALNGRERAEILFQYANAISTHEEAILEANRLDVTEAETSGLDRQLVARLKLTHEKLAILVKGIVQIAEAPDPIGRVVGRTEVAEGLILEKQTCAVGVLLVIFESRPDALPQLCALSIKSGNGLLLKGGKEASRSNAILHSLVHQAIEQATSQRVPASLIGLVTSREDIQSLLRLDKYINLVIPRGSSSLVQHITKHTKIPVLGHSEGVCHIYLHADAIPEKAIEIVKDSKLDYPAACNSVETLLIHKALLTGGQGVAVLKALAAANIDLYAPQHLVVSLERAKVPIKVMPNNDFHHEYSDTKMTVVAVDDLDAAIIHINTYGSGHTDAIITEDSQAAALFAQQVDSACVFHNASTRFADGYRFGLGAEVGISTSRIHARGPVGVDGLLTTKWLLSSSSSQGHVVGEFSKGKKLYTHRPLPLDQVSNSKAKL